MPEDMSLFKAALHGKFAGDEVQLPQSFRAEYVDNLFIVVTNLNKEYTNDVFEQILRAHIILQQMRAVLQSRRTQCYIKSLSVTEVTQHIENAVTRSFKSIADIANIDHARVERVVKLYSHQWYSHFMELLQPDIFDLEKVFADLLQYIVHNLLLLKNGLCKYYIYDDVCLTLKDQFAYLKQYVVVETDVDTTYDEMLRFTADTYRKNLNDTDSNSENNPVANLNKLLPAFYVFGTRNLDDSTVMQMLSSNQIQLVLNSHKEWLNQLEPDLSPPDLQKSLRYHWQGRKGIDNTMRAVVTNVVENLLMGWALEHGLGLAFDELKLHHSGAMVKAQVDICVSKMWALTQPFLQVPEFLQIPRDQKPIINVPKFTL